MCSLTILSSCQIDSKKTNDKTTSFETDKTTSIEKPKYYKLIGEDIIIRVGPGKEFEKLINKKATELLGETHYCEADYTFLVEVIEKKNGWAKIKTIEPEHLRNTYNGWIPYESIKFDNKPEVVKELNEKDYEILLEDKAPTVNNYHILVKKKDFNKAEAKDFIKSFRKYNSNGKSNIHLYDTKEIKHLMTKYPIEGADYIKLADHFVAMSTFDSPELVWWYPFQDVKYKEFGGKNWKKEPIK
jgi:hypothetical protein